MESAELRSMDTTELQVCGLPEHSSLQCACKSKCCCAQEPAATQISDAVTDTNPYSRLMALQRMGVVRDYRSTWPVSCVQSDLRLTLRARAGTYASALWLSWA